MNIKCNGEARPTNPGPAYASFTAFNYTGQIQEKQEVFLGKTTTERAAFRSIIMALDWLREEDAKFRIPAEVCIYTDSLGLIPIMDSSKSVCPPFNTLLETIRGQVKKLESSGVILEFKHVKKEKQRCNPFPEFPALEKVTCFKTPDGEYFESEEEAKEHARKYVFVKEIAEMFLKEEPGAKIAEALWEGRETLKRLL